MVSRADAINVQPMSRLLALACCATALACTPSPDTSPYGDVTGSVDDHNGNSFRFGAAAEGDTIQLSGTNCAGNAQESTLAIVLSTRAGFCAGTQGNIALAANEALLFTIVGSPAHGGGAAPNIAPGVYAIGDVLDGNNNSYRVSATLAVFDPLCSQEDLPATGGSIQLDSLAGGEAIGEFTLDFGSTDNSLNGSFDTHTCPFTRAQLCSMGGNHTCSN